MTPYISPFHVYVVWHPEFTTGAAIAQRLFSSLCRDTDHPLDHRLGIPVYFRSESLPGTTPPAIDFSKADHILIIALIDNKLLLKPDFKSYLVDLYFQSRSAKNVRFLPVAISESAFSLDAEVGKLNYIRCYNKTDYYPTLYQNILHELCKTLFKKKEDAEPVKLFISHSKHDEALPDAIAFRDYVNSEAQVKTFFDANDIGYGDNFEEVITENAGNCVIVAFVSDTYASREWCRQEIIIAKRNLCPILVVNLIKVGEDRSFPYLGNLPTRQWTGNKEEILNLALYVTLSNVFNNAALKRQAAFFKVPADFVLASYPELFTLVGLKSQLLKNDKAAGIVIYPDPPLGYAELDLLNQMEDRLSFLTPLQLSTFIKHGIPNI